MNERNRRLNADDDLDRARRMIASATLLLEHGHHEDAVSSAYYAAHHAARALLFSIGLEVRSHEGLRGLLAEHFERPGRVARGTTRRLKDAFAARMTATYGVRVRFSREDAAAWVAWSRRFVDHAAAHLAGFLAPPVPNGPSGVREHGPRYRKTTARKTPARKTPARKTPARKTPARKPSRKPRGE